MRQEPKEMLIFTSKLELFPHCGTLTIEIVLLIRTTSYQSMYLLQEIGISDSMDIAALLSLLKFVRNVNNLTSYHQRNAPINVRSMELALEVLVCAIRDIADRIVKEVILF